MIPTLFGVMLITFLVTQFVPGGPVERMMAVMEGGAGGGRQVQHHRLVCTRAVEVWIRNGLNSLKNYMALINLQ